MYHPLEEKPITLPHWILVLLEVGIVLCAVVVGYLWAVRAYENGRRSSTADETWKRQDARWEAENEKADQLGLYGFAVVFGAEILHKVGEWLDWRQHYDWCLLRGHWDDDIFSKAYCVDNWDEFHHEVHWGWWHDAIAPWVMHLTRDLLIAGVVAVVVLVWLSVANRKRLRTTT